MDIYSDLVDTNEYPLTPSEVRLAAVALRAEAQRIAREGGPDWEERCRTYFLTAERLLHHNGMFEVA